VIGEKGRARAAEKGPVVLKREIRYGNSARSDDGGRSVGPDPVRKIRARNWSGRVCADRLAAIVVKAWLRLDPDTSSARARETGQNCHEGASHGPWGVKDVIDTADYPTTQEFTHLRRFRVGRDAAPVAVRARGRVR